MNPHSFALGLSLTVLGVAACAQVPDPGAEALARGDYWYTGMDANGSYLAPRPDGSRSMTELCAAAADPSCAGDGCVARAVLDRYGWCAGDADSGAQVARLNAMSQADAEAIARALNARLAFVATTGGNAGSVDPYLGDALGALCAETPEGATSLKRVCDFERSQCSGGSCTMLALTWTADEAKAGAAAANRLYQSKRALARTSR